MILKSLYLKNFLAHKDTYVEFAKSGITTFIGDNGAGKSSIIDGISFALFGKATKGKNISSLLHWGTKKAIVELIFEKGNNEYKIYREIKLTGKSATTTSAIYKKEKGVFSLYYQKNINKEIPKLIGINAKTFFSSILIKQGDIEGLLNLKPKDRAKVFEDILDMTLYQLLSEYYASKRKELENQLKGIQVSTEDEKKLQSQIAELLNQRDNLLRQEKFLSEEIANLKMDIKLLEEHINKLSAKKEEILKQKSLSEKLKERLKHLENELENVYIELERLENLKKELPNLEKKVKEYEEKQNFLNKVLENKIILQKIKNLEEKLNEARDYETVYKKLKEFANVYLEKEEKYKKILDGFAKLSQINGQIKALKEQINSIRQDLFNTKNEALSIAKKLSTIKPIYKTLELNPVIAPSMIRDGSFLIEEYKRKLNEVNEKGLKVKAEIDLLQNQLKNITSIKGECPTCSRPIQEHTKKQLKEELEEKLKEKKQLREKLLKEYRNLESKIKKEEEILKHLEKFESIYEKHKELDLKLKQLKAKLAALMKEREKLENIPLEKESLEKFLKENKEKYEKFKTAKENLRKISIEDLIQKKKSLENSLENIPFKEETLKEEIEKLKPYRDKFLKVSQEISKENELKKKKEELTTQISDVRNQIKNIDNSLDDTNEIEKGILEKTEKLTTLKEYLSNKQEKLANLKEARGKIEGEIKILNSELEKVEQTLEKVKQISQKINKYKIAENVLGAKGIQRIIRENALYKLPQLVNFIFSKFGFGFNQIKFSEDFDILLLADTVERQDRYVSIDVISGGQKVALGLALRLALSHFLSSKANFLILDEPTIHLDQQRKEELVSILLNLKNENFINQLIVITHDKELEDTADQIYFVENGRVFQE